MLTLGARGFPISPTHHQHCSRLFTEQFRKFIEKWESQAGEGVGLSDQNPAHFLHVRWLMNCKEDSSLNLFIYLFWTWWIAHWLTRCEFLPDSYHSGKTALQEKMPLPYPSLPHQSFYSPAQTSWMSLDIPVSKLTTAVNTSRCLTIVHCDSMKNYAPCLPGACLLPVTCLLGPGMVAWLDSMTPAQHSNIRVMVMTTSNLSDSWGLFVARSSRWS